MKKLKPKVVWRLRRQYYLSRRKERREANARRRAYQKQLKYRRLNPQSEQRRAELRRLIKRRENLIRDLYGRVQYSEARQIVTINGDFGLEEAAPAFLNLASSFVDSRSRHLFINIRACTRLWPTAVTLLCSLKQWVQLTSTTTNRQIIGNTDSSSAEVNEYLAHCGFYDYVGRKKNRTANIFSDDTVVKIYNETDRSHLRLRAQEIIDLMRRYGLLDTEQVELFVSRVLFEVLLNITEHGINSRDQGWWLIGQYHETHGYISLCFADNGIGIRNSLMTGPQQQEIKLDNRPENDGEFIKLAMNEIVTGAVDRRYPKGTGRGKGLKKIVKTCQELNIPLMILSHYGFAFTKISSADIEIGAYPKRVFAGTMHHFRIPAKKREVLCHDNP